jgi:hypothetical protein
MVVSPLQGVIERKKINIKPKKMMINDRSWVMGDHVRVIERWMSLKVQQLKNKKDWVRSNQEMKELQLWKTKSLRKWECVTKKESIERMKEFEHIAQRCDM